MKSFNVDGEEEKKTSVSDINSLYIYNSVMRIGVHRTGERLEQ